MKSEHYQWSKEANLHLPQSKLIRPAYLRAFFFHTQVDLELIFQVNLYHPGPHVQGRKFLNLDYWVQQSEPVAEAQLLPPLRYLVSGHQTSDYPESRKLSASEHFALLEVMRFVFENYLTKGQATGKESRSGLGQGFNPPLVTLTDLLAGDD
jgi:hypothetical protein